MPTNWASYFMGPERFGLPPIGAGGYQLQPYKPFSAVNIPIETPHGPAAVDPRQSAMRRGVFDIFDRTRPSGWWRRPFDVPGDDSGPTAEGRLRGGNMPGDWDKWSSGLLRGMGWAFAPGMMAMARRDRDRLSDREQRGPGGGYGGSYGAGDRTSKGPGGTLGHI